MAGLHFDITADNTNLIEKLRETERRVKNLSDAVEQEGGGIESLFSRMTRAAAAFGAGFTATELIKNVVRVRGEFQQLEVAFTTMLGSQEKATALMSQLTETAAKTPFDLQGVADGARQLLAYGTAADDVNETLIRLGNIAAGLSIPLSELVYLYGTTMTQGRLYTQDLNQFTGRGIPMIKELAKEFGVAESEIRAMVEAGKVGFPEVQKVINNLTNEGGMFFNLMQEQSKTITGQISNIGDSFSTMLNEIGKSSEGVINDVLGGVSYLIENYETVGKTLLEIVGTYGAYKAALITIIALQKAYSAILAQSALNQSLAAASGVTLSNAQALAATRTKLLQAAQAALNKTMLANPYVLAAAAVAALGLGIYKLVTYQTEAEKAQERLNEAVKESEKASLSEQRELARLKGELSALKEGTDEYNNVKEKIIAGYGKYYDGLEEEINKVGLTEEAYNKLTDAITRSYGARQYQQFKSQQESELDDVMSENLSKIQDRLIDRLGEEAGSKYYAKIRDAIMQGSLTAINGTANIAGLDKETSSALDKAAKVGLGIENRAVEAYIAEILNAIELTDELDKKAQARFGIFGGQSNAQSVEAPFSAEGKSISQLEEEIGKAQTRLESLRKAFADGSGTKEAVEQQEAYIRSLQDAVLEREKELAVIGEVETQMAKLKKEQKETAYGSKEYHSLQSRIDALDAKLPRTKAERNEASRQKEIQQKLSDELLELRRRNQKAETDLMEEGTQKKLKRIDDDYEAQKAEIEKKAQELAELNKKTGASGAAGGGLTSEQQSAIDEALRLNEEERAKAVSEVYEAEAEAMREYLRQYGTFQQQKLAIAEEYAEKIRKAQTEGERLSLEKERDAAVNKVEMESVSQQVDWGSVFGNFGVMFKEQIRPTIERLEEIARSDEFQSSGLEEKEILYSLISGLRQSETLWDGDIFREISEDLAAYRNAMNAYMEAQQRETAATRRLAEAKERLKAAEESGDSEERDAAQLAVDEASANLGKASKDVQRFGSQVQQTTSGLQEAAERAANMFGGLESGLQGLSSGSLKGIGQGVMQLDKLFSGGKLTERLGTSLVGGFQKLFGSSKVTEALTKGLGNAGLAGSIISAVLGMLDTIAEEGVSGIVSGLIDTVFGAVNSILKDALSFNMVEKVGGSLIDGLKGTLDTITFGGFSSWLNLGGNDKEVQETIDRLTESNEYLRRSIDGLAERINQSDTTNEQSVDYYNRARQSQLDWEETQREIIKEAASAWTNSGYGFLGMGGKGSFNAHAPGSGWEGWDAFTETLRKNGFNITVSGTEQLWELTPEQMKLLRDSNPSEWQQLFSGDGHRNPKEYVDEYIEAAGTLEELTDSLNEKLTGYDWSGFLDQYKSLLKNMESSTEDFADFINETISNALIEAFVNEQLQDDIKELYQYMADHAADGLSDTEIDAIRRMNEEIADKSIEWRQRMAEAGLIDESSSAGQQTATSKGFETMTQDQASELSGRFTALYEVAIQMLDGFQTILSISISVSEQNSILSEIRNLAVLSNGYLEDIAGFQKRIWEKLDSRLDTISETLNSKL